MSEATRPSLMTVGSFPVPVRITIRVIIGIRFGLRVWVMHRNTLNQYRVLRKLQLNTRIPKLSKATLGGGLRPP